MSDSVFVPTQTPDLKINDICVGSGASILLTLTAAAVLLNRAFHQTEEAAKQTTAVNQASVMRR